MSEFTLGNFQFTKEKLIIKKFFSLVVCPKITNSSALGVAVAAAQAEGIEIWKFDDNEEKENFSKINFVTFSPTTTEEGWMSFKFIFFPQNQIKFCKINFNHFQKEIQDMKNG